MNVKVFRTWIRFVRRYVQTTLQCHWHCRVKVCGVFKWFLFLLGMVVHQPFSLFLRPFILFYVNLCAHLETQSLWLKCFDLWQAGYNPTGSLLISLGSIEIVAFCIGRIFVQRMVNRTLCLVPIDPCVVQYHSAMWLWGVWSLRPDSTLLLSAKAAASHLK